MVDENVHVLDSTETFRFLPGGKAQPIMRIRWMYRDNHGPYTTDLPVDAFTWTQFDDAIRARVDELRARGL